MKFFTLGEFWSKVTENIAQRKLAEVNQRHCLEKIIAKKFQGIA